MRKLFVFDFYDTLVHFDTAFPPTDEVVRACADVFAVPAEIARRAVEQCYVPLAIGLLDRENVQRPTTETVGEALVDLGVDHDAEQVDEFLWRVFAGDEPACVVLPGAAEALAAVVAHHHEARLLTGCLLPGPLMARLLDVLGLRRFFTMLWCSSDGVAKKPQPGAFLAVGAGDFAERVMVGDVEALDLEPAAGLGWTTVRISPTAPDFSPVHALL